MIRFLTTSGIASEIEKIIRGAKQELHLVSPYLQFSENFVERLQDADKKGIGICIIFGKNQLTEHVEKTLGQLKHLRLCFYEHLHAKCYFNEHLMVITSMNLYEYSEKNNREMGILISKEEKVFGEAQRETKSILEHSKKYKLKRGSGSGSFLRLSRGKESTARQKRKRSQSATAYCIRCGQETLHNLEKPYCRKCYTVWAKWEDSEYEEQICHSCGQEAKTSMSKPECYACYKNRVA